MDSSAAPFFSEVVVLALVQEGLDGGVEDGRLWVKVYGLKDRLTTQKHEIGKNATNEKIGGGRGELVPTYVYTWFCQILRLRIVFHVRRLSPVNVHLSDSLKWLQRKQNLLRGCVFFHSIRVYFSPLNRSR